MGKIRAEEQEMTIQKAYELLTKKYPQANIQISDIYINDENREIEVWTNSCEWNNGNACTDWFDFDGNHKWHKCK